MLFDLLGIVTIDSLVVSKSKAFQALKRRAGVLVDLGKYDEAVKDAQALQTIDPELSRKIVRFSYLGHP